MSILSAHEVDITAQFSNITSPSKFSLQDPSIHPKPKPCSYGLPRYKHKNGSTTNKAVKISQ